MKTKHSNLGLFGVGLLSAVAASLCCATPILALISGLSGVASAFAWLEPIRPYLIASTAAVLGVAWFQRLKPKKASPDECACDEKSASSFWKSNSFLAIVTVFAGLMVAFPYYSGLFYWADHRDDTNSSQRARIQPVSGEIDTVTFSISGMTCVPCEEYIKESVRMLPGVIEIDASYQESIASVVFEVNRVSIDRIKEAISNTGYEAEIE